MAAEQHVVSKYNDFFHRLKYEEESKAFEKWCVVCVYVCVCVVCVCVVCGVFMCVFCVCVCVCFVYV